MIQDVVNEIANELSFFDDPEDAYAYIIDLGKRHAGLAPQEKTDPYLVKGCQSRVWLHHHREDGRHRFRTDGDAFIVRGLLALVTRVFDDREATEILSIGPEELLGKVGLKSFITPGRQNGVRAIIERIHAYARAEKTVTHA